MKMDDDSEFSMSGSDDGGSVSVAVSRGGSAQPEGVRRGSRRQSSAQQPAGRGTQPRPREKRQRIRPHGSRSQSAHLTDSERLHAFALLDEFARTHNGNLHGGKAFVAKALGVSGTTMTRVYKDWVERHERGIPYQANSSVQANTSIGSNLSSVSNLSAAAGAQQPVQASAQPPAQSPAAQFKRQLPSPAYPQQQKQQQQPTAPIERESISPAESYRRNQIPGIQLPIPPQPAFQQFPQPQQAYQNPPFQPPQPSYPQQPSYPPQQSYPQQQSYDQQPYPAQQPYPQQQQQFQQQQPYYRPQYYSPNQPFSPQQPFYDYNDHAPSPYPEAPPYTGFGFEERLVSPTGPEPLFTGPPNILPHRASLSGTLDPPLFPADHSNDSKGRDRGGFTSKESEEEEEEEEEDFGPLVPPESLQAERKAHDVDEICHRGAFLNLWVPLLLFAWFCGGSRFLLFSARFAETNVVFFLRFVWFVRVAFWG